VDGGEFGDEGRDGRRVDGVGVDDGVGVGAAVDGEMHGEFARREQGAEDLSAVEVDADRVGGSQAVVGDA
jgi:hypothetical protein